MVPPCIRRPLEQSSLSIKPESSTTRSCPRTRSSTFALELRRSWRGRKRAPVGDRPLSEAARGSVRSEFNAYLQRSAVDGPYKELDVHGQVASDALAIRHHTAEALLRLACARLAPEPITGPRCLWAEIATGPRPIEDVITRLNDSAKSVVECVPRSEQRRRPQPGPSAGGVPLHARQRLVEADARPLHVLMDSC
jgi:hypothetical protein